MGWPMKWTCSMRMTIFSLVLALSLGSCVPYGAQAEDAAMLGDSIAQGTGAKLHVTTYAWKGIGSCAFLKRMPTASYQFTGLSIGINDSGACVALVRAKIIARRVVWILPAAINPARLIVATVAADYHDGTISYACAGGCSKVNFHPASYAVVAKAMRRAWAQH